MPTGERKDPYTAFRFRVEIDGITVANVSEVTGLQLETETETYEEGGVNDFVHLLPKRTKYSNITLKRGITDLDEMWRWHQEVIQGKFRRRSRAPLLRPGRKGTLCHGCRPPAGISG